MRNLTNYEENDSSATGSNAHAEGSSTKALGASSHVEGIGSMSGGMAFYPVEWSVAGKTITLNVGDGANFVVGDTVIVQEMTKKLGDVDGNNVLTAGDASTVSNFIKGTATPTADQKILGDLTSDGTLGLQDAQMILDVYLSKYPQEYAMPSYLTTIVTAISGDTITVKDTLNSGNATDYGIARVQLTTGKGADAGAYAHAEGYYTQAGGPRSHAEGSYTLASGGSSHAEGSRTKANGGSSHAEGFQSVANGTGAHAEGGLTLADSAYAHAEGYTTLAMGGCTVVNIVGFNNAAKTITVASVNGFAVNNKVRIRKYPSSLYTYSFDATITAIDSTNRTFTLNTTQTLDANCRQCMKFSYEGSTAHAEGSGSMALGASSHAEGANTLTLGANSHAEGDTTVAYGSSSHAEGLKTLAGDYSHAEGQYTIAQNCDFVGKVLAYTANTLTLDSVTGLNTSDTLYAVVTDGAPVQLNITAIDTTNKIITIATTGTTASSWIMVLRKSSTMAHAHAEGYGTIATISYAHAEGINTVASGFASHAEGSATTASGYISHAEGGGTTASGSWSHAEGINTIASGTQSHAEGNGTKATGVGSHAEGSGTLASVDYSHAEGVTTTASGFASHAEGNSTVAGSDAAHAEGYYTVAMQSSITATITAFDNVAKTLTLNTVAGLSVGNSITVSRKLSGPPIYGIPITAVSGNVITLNTGLTIDSNWAVVLKNAGISNPTHAEGSGTIASGINSHAEGSMTTASGQAAHAEGQSTTASGNYAHAEGYNTIASGDNSHAEGYNTSTNALSGAHIMGQYGDANASYAWFLANGTSIGAKGLATKILSNGQVFSDGAYASTGADYAEMFEWADGNPNNEDRVGYFVAFDEEHPDKIRIANSSDDYIVGIVSANPTVIGDNADMHWKGRWLTDEWGRRKYEEVTVPAVMDGDVIVIPEHTITQGVVNPDWDPSTDYVPREQRSEWSPIGLMGKLLVGDDGTCIPGKYCKCGENGVGTRSDSRVDGYRVLKRISKNQVLVLVK